MLCLRVKLLSAKIQETTGEASSDIWYTDMLTVPRVSSVRFVMYATEF
jgi:hypothetical protein